MNLVAGFKKKIENMEKKTGWKYNVTYDGYTEALENNRNHLFWHKPGTKLAEITVGDETVVFEIKGDLDMYLRDADGLEYAHYEGVVIPGSIMDNTRFEETGIPKEGVDVLVDKDIISLTDGSRDDGFYLDIVKAPEIAAYLTSNEDSKYALDDVYIGKPLFYDEFIKDFVNSNAKADEPVKEEPEAEDEKDSEPEEEKAKPADVPASEKKPKDEPKVQTEKKSESAVVKSELVSEDKSGSARTSNYSGDKMYSLLPLRIIGEFFSCETEKDAFGYLVDYQESLDSSYFIKAAKAFVGEFYDNPESAILDCSSEYLNIANEHGTANECLGAGVRILLELRRGNSNPDFKKEFLCAMIIGAENARP